jgi:hypothetical protein
MRPLHGADSLVDVRGAVFLNMLNCCNGRSASPAFDAHDWGRLEV